MALTKDIESVPLFQYYKKYVQDNESNLIKLSNRYTNTKPFYSDTYIKIENYSEYKICFGKEPDYYSISLVKTGVCLLELLLKVDKKIIIPGYKKINKDLVNDIHLFFHTLNTLLLNQY